MVERGHKTFRKERTEARPLPDGAWETVLVAIKSELGSSFKETTGVGDSDFWIEIEDRVSMKPNEACMEFYLHNIGHRTLAEIVTFSFQTVRTATKLGDMGKEETRLLKDRISNKLLQYYPPKYRIKFGK